MKKVYKFLIFLRGYDDCFYREVDISSDCTLIDLYYIILSSFDMILDERLSNGKCSCCSRKCDFLNPKTKVLNNLSLKKAGVKLASRLEIICNCNGFYIFDLQVVDCKLITWRKSKDYPKIVYGKGKGIYPNATPEVLQKIIDSINEKGESEFKYRNAKGELLTWDYREYDLESDNRKLKVDINFLKNNHQNKELSILGGM